MIYEQKLQLDSDYPLLFCVDMQRTLFPLMKASPYLFLSCPFRYSSLCSSAMFMQPSRQARTPVRKYLLFFCNTIHDFHFHILLHCSISLLFLILLKICTEVTNVSNHYTTTPTTVLNYNKKKRKMNECSNYRGLSLQSVPETVYIQ